MTYSSSLLLPLMLGRHPPAARGRLYTHNGLMLRFGCNCACTHSSDHFSTCHLLLRSGGNSPTSLSRSTIDISSADRRRNKEERKMKDAIGGERKKKQTRRETELLLCRRDGISLVVDACSCDGERDRRDEAESGEITETTTAGK